MYREVGESRLANWLSLGVVKVVDREGLVVGRAVVLAEVADKGMPHVVYQHCTNMKPAEEVGLEELCYVVGKDMVPERWLQGKVAHTFEQFRMASLGNRCCEEVKEEVHKDCKGAELVGKLLMVGGKVEKQEWDSNRYWVCWVEEAPGVMDNAVEAVVVVVCMLDKQGMDFEDCKRSQEVFVRSLSTWSTRVLVVSVVSEFQMISDMIAGRNVFLVFGKRDEGIQIYWWMGFEGEVFGETYSVLKWYCE